MKCGRTACHNEAEGHINTDQTFRNYCLSCAILINKANPGSFQVEIKKLDHWKQATPRDQAIAVKNALQGEYDNQREGITSEEQNKRIEQFEKEMKLLFAFVRGYAKW